MMMFRNVRLGITSRNSGQVPDSYGDARQIDISPIYLLCALSGCKGGCYGHQVYCYQVVARQVAMDTNFSEPWSICWAGCYGYKILCSQVVAMDTNFTEWLLGRLLCIPNSVFSSGCYEYQLVSYIVFINY